MRSVTVVTDSSAYLPRELAEQHGIEVVSHYYVFGDGEPERDADLEDYSSFYDRLAASEALPTSSPATVEDFVNVYEPLLADRQSVVSVHLSSGLSETCANARQAVEELTASGQGGERVEVLDSATTVGQLGLVVLAAAANTSRDADAIAEHVRQARLEANGWMLLDTLEYLRRGGRIGSAAAWIGSTLNVKPILTVESEVRAVERVRSRERGIERLLDYARKLHAGGASAWMVQHTAAPEDAHALVERLQPVFGRPPEFVSEIGAVLGTNLGPRLICVGGIPPRFLE